MTIYQCEDSMEGIFCGIYDAWASGSGHQNVRVEVAGEGRTMELFCEYRDVPVDEEKVEKVIRSIRRKISEEAYEMVYKSALSREEGRADKIYRFLIQGFHYGPSVIDMLQLPAVCDIFEMCRFINNEAHFEVEFLRFTEMEEGLLVSRIKPKNDVLVLVAPHFADRLSGENWMIYDEGRKKAVLHPAGRGWAVMPKVPDGWETQFQKAFREDQYKSLWKAFRKSAAIKERYNPVCQRNHLPLRYRPYMTEFEEGLWD